MAKRYAWPWWVFIRECRDANGFDCLRTADAIAVGMYRSRGQLVVGFEQKVSRADWLRELKNPDKAEGIAQFCDQWYIVIPDQDEDIATVDELPPTWGLLVVSGQRVKIAKLAQTINCKPLTRVFLAAIVKRVVEDATAPYKKKRGEMDAAQLKEEWERGRLGAARELERAEKLRGQVEAFEKASGISITEWSYGKQIGEAVSKVLSEDGFRQRVSSMAIRYAQDLRREADALDSMAVSLRKVDGTGN